MDTPAIEVYESSLSRVKHGQMCSQTKNGGWAGGERLSHSENEFEDIGNATSALI